MGKEKYGFNITEEEEMEIVNGYQAGLGGYKLAKKFMVSCLFIYLILEEKGIPRRTLAEANQRALTKEQEQEVVEKYQKMMSSLKLAKEFGVTSSTIIATLKRNGIPRRSFDLAGRKHKVFDEAFGSLDSEESQYWAGFIDADGCIQEHGNSYKITVNLQKGDYEHLVKLRKFLKSDAPIYTQRETRGLVVASKRIGKRLISLGVTPRKSYKNNTVGERLAHSKHFWRGMIDGDGWVLIDKNGWSRLGLCGSHDLIAQFSDYIESVSGFRNKIGKTGSIYRIGFGCNTATLLAKHFYENATIYLNRKKETADKMIQNP